MNIMTELENIIMRLTGCHRSVANEAANQVIDAWEDSKEEEQTC